MDNPLEKTAHHYFIVMPNMGATVKKAFPGEFYVFDQLKDALAWAFNLKSYTHQGGPCIYQVALHKNTKLETKEDIARILPGYQCPTIHAAGIINQSNIIDSPAPKRLLQLTTKTINKKHNVKHYAALSKNHAPQSLADNTTVKLFNDSSDAVAYAYCQSIKQGQSKYSLYCIDTKDATPLTSSSLKLALDIECEGELLYKECVEPTHLFKLSFNFFSCSHATKNSDALTSGELHHAV